jgi:peptidoglycan hydrolase-like protein with peptidoglycan-binding domain
MASQNLPVLIKGSNGQAVKLVQQLLNAYVPYIKNAKSIKEDSDFGQNTEQAIITFQKAYRNQFDATLEGDGKVGNLTWRALGDFGYRHSPAGQS